MKARTLSPEAENVLKVPERLSGFTVFKFSLIGADLIKGYTHSQ